MSYHILTKNIETGEILSSSLITNTVLFFHEKDACDVGSKVKEVITADNLIYKTKYDGIMLKLTKSGWSSGGRYGKSYHYTKFHN